jgi:hypothetical protein
VVRKERGVFEKVPGSDIWWIRFKDAGVEHREKVARRGDVIKLYKIRKADILRGVKMRANMKDKASSSPCLPGSHRLVCQPRPQGCSEF